jgi:hypothetical protein
MEKRLQFLLGKHVVNGNLGVRDADPVYTAIALNKANRVSNTPPIPSRLLPRRGRGSIPTYGLRILVAEDLADCAESMALLLDMYGHEVKVARNGPGNFRRSCDLQREGLQSQTISYRAQFLRPDAGGVRLLNFKRRRHRRPAE